MKAHTLIVIRTYKRQSLGPRVFLGFSTVFRVSFMSRGSVYTRGKRLYRVDSG